MSTEDDLISTNPYLAAWLDAVGCASFDEWRALPWHERSSPLRRNRAVGETSIDDLPIMKREALSRRFSWAVPNDQALETIAQYSPILEIGAGSGYWASLLAHRGCDVVAYDAQPPRYDRVVNGYHPSTEQYFRVRRGGPEKIDCHPHRTLFLCWPPYSDPMAAACAKRYRGDVILFVGEGPGGCTGDDAFFDHLREEFQEPTEVEIPQWPGIHDALFIFRRRVLL